MTFNQYVWALLVGCVGSCVIGAYFGAAIALSNCAQQGQMEMRTFLAPVECKWKAVGQ